MSKHIATIPTFTKDARYVERGGMIDDTELDDVESGNVIEAPSGINENAVVEISAIAPSGPNPQNPQQLPIGATQVPGGYAQDGAKLVGEVTKPEKQRIEVVGIDPEDDTQAKVTEALDKAGNQGNLSNEGTEGTVADVSARAADMDAAALDDLEARENDREKPRKGVLDAIEARRAALEDSEA
jgi:hypothetical protein